MAVALVRRELDLDPRDAEAARGWLLARVRDEVRERGEPVARLLLLFDGHQEFLPLAELDRRDPTAHAGATFQALRARPGWIRRFLVSVVGFTDAEGRAHRNAMVFEERDGEGGRRIWWMALLPFTNDPATGLGVPAGDWQRSNGETDDPRHLFPFLRGYVSPPPDARPTAVEPPPALERPDLRMTWGELGPEVPLPTDAKQFAELAFHLAAKEILTGAASGTLVVRLAERSWELWVLGGDAPFGHEELARFVANVREPVADAVAVLMAVIRPSDDPPVPGIQVIAELGGFWAELWAPLEFPDGPAGRKVVSRMAWWAPRPVPESGMFLHVRPTIDFVPLPGEPEA